jgi:hypothetical protein
MRAFLGDSPSRSEQSASLPGSWPCRPRLGQQEKRDGVAESMHDGGQPSRCFLVGHPVTLEEVVTDRMGDQLVGGKEHQGASTITQLQCGVRSLNWLVKTRWQAARLSLVGGCFRQESTRLWGQARLVRQTPGLKVSRCSRKVAAGRIVPTVATSERRPGIVTQHPAPLSYWNQSTTGGRNCKGSEEPWETEPETMAF